MFWVAILPKVQQSSLDDRPVYPWRDPDIQESDMTKRLVDIDDEILDEARRALGTTTLKDTVNQSLRNAAEASRRRKITKQDLQAFVEATEDLRNPEIMAKAWE
jgi:Arc/MetJ family transcription regulator